MTQIVLEKGVNSVKTLKESEKHIFVKSYFDSKYCVFSKALTLVRIQIRNTDKKSKIYLFMYKRYLFSRWL
jgi:hypothetical protein